MSNVARRIVIGDWKPWFAWRPIKVHGRYTWLKTVYRRDTAIYVDNDVFFKYEYSTLFDILSANL